MRGAVGLSPLTVFVAILTGTTFMGVTGAILAIPIAAGVQVILSNYFAARQVKRDSQQQPSGWRWMLNRAGGRYDPDGVTVVEEFDGDDQSTQTVSDDIYPIQPNDPEPVPAGPTAPPVTPSTGKRRNWSPFSESSSAPAAKQEPDDTTDA
jgi:hypothetical protein